MRAHGVRGAVLVKLISDRDERMAVGGQLSDGTRTFTVTASQRQPQGSWLVSFAELEDRNAAEAAVGTLLSAAPLDDPDALWVDELIGAAVVGVDGTSYGRCVAVLANPAHDILELESGALVPVVFVRSLIDGVATIDPPDGLFDL